MVILNTFSGGHSWIYSVSLMLTIIFAFIACIYLFVYLFNNIKSVNRWLGFIALLCCLGLSIFGVVKTTETGYKIYSNGVSLEEIETEYEIDCIDGLILTAYKKK